MNTASHLAERTLWDELGWRAIFLTKVPSLPIIMLGIMLAVIAVTPRGDYAVIYFGVGFAAITGLVLTQVPVPAVRHPRQRILLCGAVVLTTVLAYIIDVNKYVLAVGLALVL